MVRDSAAEEVDPAKVSLFKDSKADSLSDFVVLIWFRELGRRGKVADCV